ncbi:MAG: ATP-dependent DNA helicase RecG [Francisellaceae bacterium]|jgi:ATP-dependent DNA helicase RecG|nr:ATP-dependent DNA helicase RecG [Francisellaceae bacterium]
MEKSNLLSLKGVGPKLIEKLKSLRILSIADLTMHFPRRYLDKTKIVPISQLILEDHALIDGRILYVKITGKPRPSMTVEIEDDTGSITIRWFKYYPYQDKRFVMGSKIRCFGKIQYYGSSKYMAHPEYIIYTESSTLAVDTSLTPVYGTTAGLNQKTIIKLIRQAIDGYQEQENNTKIDNIFAKTKVTYQQAIMKLHFPDAGMDLTKYKKRLALEEMLAHHLAHRSVKSFANKKQGIEIPINNTMKTQFIDMLPFTLTNAQQKVIGEIFNDIKQSQPMMRLVQGDVGSGKTVVAMFAALMAVDCATQVAVMAPTEILSIQHYENFSNWAKKFNIKVALYTGSLNAKQQKDMLENIAMGMFDIIIGTHALFQDKVIFNKLSLVIVDEQHKFGVEQRERLLSKGSYNERVPHLLVMTATPIPRTLALIFYADLDCSTIDEVPPTRKAIKTIALSNTRRDEVINKVKELCNKGQQIYWVCPFIDESEVLTGQAVEIVVKELEQKLSPLSVALLHGKIDNDKKENIMNKFKNKELDILCATTVIEVGVDVPNATLMVIENPERMGLSQLHQLRGRVGRGYDESYCILLYQDPLSENARLRLDIMRKHQDGFKIAEFDLELRGPGELFGTKQTGMPDFKVADLSVDIDLLPEVRNLADLVSKSDPDLVKHIVHRWLVQDGVTNVL